MRCMAAFNEPEMMDNTAPAPITASASFPLLCPYPHIQASLSMIAPIINKTRPMAQPALQNMCPAESGESMMTKESNILTKPEAHMMNLRSLLSNSKSSFRIPMKKHINPHPKVNPQALAT